MSGFCTPTDPDEALRTAIKAAVDAGRFEMAARLLEVMRETRKVAEVVPIRGKAGPS